MDLLNRKIVNINELEYTISESDDGEYVNLDDDGKPAIFGRHIPSEQLIVIHKRLKPEAKKRTLAHELAHAFMYAYGFDGQKFDEESVCDFISIYGHKITRIVNRYFGEVIGYAENIRD